MPLEHVDAAIATLADEPTEPKEGRGIVMAAGGVKFQINAWVCIRMLRDLGCQLPIQCWYLGESERNQAWEQIVASYGVECIDAYQVREKYPHARLHGWELKPYAIQHSPFAEVLFLDADNVPVCDPTFLFETPQYQEHGAIFWPDFGRLGSGPRGLARVRQHPVSRRAGVRERPDRGRQTPLLERPSNSATGTCRTATISITSTSTETRKSSTWRGGS